MGIKALLSLAALILVVGLAGFFVYRSGWKLPFFAATIYNVKDYGAKGNGTTDDTGSIQAAVNAARDAGGGTVYLPPGSYLVSKQTRKAWVIQMYSNITMTGEGKNSWLKLADDQKGDAWVVANVPGVNVHDINIDNFSIDGNKANQNIVDPGDSPEERYKKNSDRQHKHGIIFFAAKRVNITRMYVKNVGGDGIYLSHSGGDPVSNARVTDNVIDGAPRVGINFAGANNSLAKGNRIIGPTIWVLKMELDGDSTKSRRGNTFVSNTGTDVGGCVGISGTELGAWNYDMTITDNTCVLKSNTPDRLGIYLRNVARASIKRNTITGDVWAGIYLFVGTSDILVEENTVVGRPDITGDWGCITLGRGEAKGDIVRLTIRKNRLSRCTTGIILTKPGGGKISETAISGNIVRENTGSGLVLAKAEKTAVQSNQFVGNGGNGVSIRKGNVTSTIEGNRFENPRGGRQFNSGILFETCLGVSGLLIKSNLFLDSGIPLKGSTCSAQVTSNTFSGTAFWDPPALLNGASTSTTVTVYGAVVGLPVSASFPYLPSGMQITANITGPNTVQVTITNNSGARVNLEKRLVRAEVKQL
jgi:parallel beta-helix repeat protein